MTEDAPMTAARRAEIERGLTGPAHKPSRPRRLFVCTCYAHDLLTELRRVEGLLADAVSRVDSMLEELDEEDWLAQELESLRAALAAKEPTT